MALFTDGTAVGINDLTQYDSALLEVSVVEGIDLTTKLSLAHDEIGVELEELFAASHGGYEGTLNCNRTSTRNVVVNTPLKMWQAYNTLALVYRDAYFNQLNDRYQAKWREYAALANAAKNKLRETGVALVADPIARAAAPSVSVVAAAENGGTFYLSVSYVNLAGEEGQSSAPVTVTTADGNVPDVLPANPPVQAVAWNLYGGTSPETLYLQNPSPLDIASDIAFYPSTAATTGTLPGNGQTAKWHKKLPRLLQRG